MSDSPWLVYLLECADGTLFCGITTNIERRLGWHNGQVPGGARATRRGGGPCGSLPAGPAAAKVTRYGLNWPSNRARAPKNNNFCLLERVFHADT